MLLSPLTECNVYKFSQRPFLLNLYLNMIVSVYLQVGKLPEDFRANNCFTMF